MSGKMSGNQKFGGRREGESKKIFGHCPLVVLELQTRGILKRVILKVASLYLLCQAGAIFLLHTVP